MATFTTIPTIIGIGQIFSLQWSDNSLRNTTYTYNLYINNTLITSVTTRIIPINHNYIIYTI